MSDRLRSVLDSIGEEFGPRIQKGARHYLEVSVGERAGRLGYADLKKKYRNTYAVVPLKAPQKGMKVRIDGRTFVNYAEDDNGIAFPGFLARATGRSVKTFVPHDSMVCNFT